MADIPGEIAGARDVNSPLAAGRMGVLARALDDLNADRFADVSRRCAPLLQRNPNDIEALLLAGLAAGARGHAGHAAGLLHRASAQRGTADHPCLDLAAILHRIGRPEWIEPQFRASLRLAPDDVELLHALADFLYDADRAADAVPLLIAATRSRPDFLPARNLLALALAALGDTAAAIAELGVVIERDPSRAAAWSNLGMLLKDDGRFDEALAAYDQALNLAPNDPQTRVNRVVAQLRAGRWAEAWPDFEWRLSLPGHATMRPGLLPSLAGGPDLAGRTILVTHEDGLGDTLQFARYLPLLAARGARVIACVPSPLVRIMRSVPGVALVRGLDDPPPPYDFYCPFNSLPRVFATTPDTIPELSYLNADPALSRLWNTRLPAGPLRVGLVWAGQARPALPGFFILDGRRSMTLASLSQFWAVPGMVFISLQMAPNAPRLTPPPGMTLFDPMPEVTDFADTAAIIANLDLVITVDTSVLHLAAAMGKPVFLLDRYDHCWRWLSGRQDSPWYPSLRIFRQSRIGEWGPVLQQATAALEMFAKATISQGR